MKAIKRINEKFGEGGTLYVDRDRKEIVLRLFDGRTLRFDEEQADALRHGIFDCIMHEGVFVL